MVTTAIVALLLMSLCRLGRFSLPPAMAALTPARDRLVASDEITGGNQTVDRAHRHGGLRACEVDPRTRAAAAIVEDRGHRPPIVTHRYGDPCAIAEPTAGATAGTPAGPPLVHSPAPS